MKEKLHKIRLSKLYKKWYILIPVAAVLTVLVFLVCSISFIQETEYKFLDSRFKLNPVPQKADTNIVIIAIDDYSLDFFSENGISWPWPRSFYGYTVDYFTSAGARSIIFDMQFYEPDIDREETYAEETDGMFANAIENNGNVYLGTQLLLDSTYIHPELIKFSIPLKEKEKLYKYNGVRAPIDPFIQAARSIGIINSSPDGDGVVRRVSMLYRLNENIFPQMGFCVWLNQQDKTGKIKKSDRKIKINEIEIPVDKSGKYLLNWYGIEPFTTYPFRAVIASASAVASGSEPILPLETFKDKHIIIGATAAGLMDLKTNPYSKVMPGMEIWATALSNFLNQDFIRVVPGWMNFLITFLVIFLILFSVTNLKPRKATILVLLILFFIVVMNFILWKNNRILLNFTMQFIGFIISYLLVNILSYLLEGKSKREIRKIFTRYLHADVISQLEDDPNQIQLGGEEIDATVLYTDIYNFTTLSESKKPKELVEDLNKYFEKLVEMVFNNSGLLDKYTGDGIMALFGAPISRPDHAILACKSAFAHKKYCEDLMRKEKLSPDEKLHLQTRIGINSGLFVAGNIGSEKRMDYTAIGDTVNLAARLEGVNKIYQTNIIMSESTYNHIKEIFLCRELDSLRVKGKTKPTRIFELIAEYDGKAIPDWIEEYKKALEMYRNGNWQEAGSIFMELSKQPFEDTASKIMLARCKYLLEIPPVKWDGILTLEVK
ncbi:MAG: adenylate/guanylate cyclase domain-containing protein [Candidatus Cloacimonetes bacterium]|nr:adenylate/guanylate cyclase domain-containing protein [Candidatus Cloacimonadota bacterium]